MIHGEIFMMDGRSNTLCNFIKLSRYLLILTSIPDLFHMQFSTAMSFMHGMEEAHTERITPIHFKWRVFQAYS